MEVLMSRTRRRVSRGLIALLVIVVVLGGIFYFHNTSKTAAREQQARASQPIHVMNPSGPKIETGPPSTAPVASRSAAPATQPARTGSDPYVSSTPNVPGPRLSEPDIRSNTPPTSPTTG